MIVCILEKHNRFLGRKFEEIRQILITLMLTFRGFDLKSSMKFYCACCYSKTYILVLQI